MPRSFPIALKLERRACLVVGSGPEAATRAKALIDSGARVQCVAAAPCAGLTSLSDSGLIELSRREFEERDLDGQWLAVLTQRDAELAARMAKAADARRIFFCATDQPEHNSFSHLALARAGLVTVAVGTEGQAPALGRRLREVLERLITDSGLAEFARELAELRQRTPSAERHAVLGKAVSHVTFDGRLKLRDEP